jgi:hypothetical protein
MSQLDAIALVAVANEISANKSHKESHLHLP